MDAIELPPIEEIHSLKAEEHDPGSSAQITETPKGEMTTKEAAAFLGWAEDKLNSRRKRGQPVEGKGWKFTSKKQGGKVVWMVQKATDV